MNFEWSFPTRIIFGAGRFSQTHKLVRGFGKRALIVTSQSFLAGGKREALLAELQAQLTRIGVETLVAGPIEPNPRDTTIDLAAKAVREFRPRYVIALGGGSVMDAAKCLALLAANEGGIWEYVYRGPGKPMRPFNHALPIVCIPTVAATSSETSLYAVVTNKKEGLKTAVFNEALIPTLSILDPELTMSIDARQTVDGAFDMITHVIESYLSTREPAPLQDRLTEAMIETVITHLPRALSAPRDVLARSQLSWCGALALSGVLSGREGGWPVHALEHGLSAAVDSAHGRGLALILPRIMKFDEQAIPEKLAAFNRKLFGAPSLETGFFSFMRDVGAWTRLGELVPPGMNAEKVIESAVEHAMTVKGIWKTGQEPYLENIRVLSRADAREVLGACR